MSGCCALGTCTDPTCDLCTRVAKLPQPEWTKDRDAKYATPDPKRKKEKKHPMFEKSHRKALR